MEEEDVCELIRSVIMSSKGGVLLKNLNKDFISLAGEPIPYAKLGYKSIEEFLRVIPDVKRSVDKNGEVQYSSEGKNCEHLANLISKQRSNKTKSSSKVINHPKHTVSNNRHGYSGSHQGRKTSRRNSMLCVDQNTKAYQHQKTVAGQKIHPKERDFGATASKNGLDSGSGAKIDLPSSVRHQGRHWKHSHDRVLREPSRFNDYETEQDEIPALVRLGGAAQYKGINTYLNLEKPSKQNGIPALVRLGSAARFRDINTFQDHEKPPKLNEISALIRLGSAARFRDVNAFQDHEKPPKHNEIPALVRLGSAARFRETNTLQNLENPQGVYQDFFQSSEKPKWKPGMDLRATLSSNHSRDFFYGRMRSDSIQVNHVGHRRSPHLRKRFSYDMYDLESQGRLGIPSSFFNNDDGHGLEEIYDSRWDSESDDSFCTDRKCDLVDGMLRVTIKND